jgi:hypothetical protein
LRVENLRRGTVCLLTIGWVAAFLVTSARADSPRLNLMWPDAWEIRPPQTRSQVVYLSARERRGTEITQTLQLTTLSVARASQPVTLASVRELANRLMHATAATSVEPEPALRQFPHRDGYYFIAEDKAPKAGDFRQLVVGVILANGYLVNFTLLTHDAGSKGTLAMLEALDRVDIS